MKKFITDNFTMIVFILLLLGGIKSCADGRRMDKIEKRQVSIEKKMDSINNSNLLIFEALLEREGYKISKRIVYDNNSIVRTKERPDDIMMEYDMFIEQGEKTISKLKGQK